MEYEGTDVAVVEDRRTVSDYIGVLKQRKYALIVPMVIGMAATIVITLNLPPTYRSSGTILIESAQVPAEYVQSSITSYVDERLQIIRQRVLTRQNLLGVIEKYGLTAGVGNASRDDIAEDLRDAIEVQPIAAGRGRSAATIAFTIAFEHGDPNTAYGIANELVTRFMNENARNRTEKATEAKLFLGQEAERLNKQVLEIEDKISQYRGRHVNLLPEREELYNEKLGRLDERLRQLDAAVGLEKDRIALIGTQMATLGSATGGATDPGFAVERMRDLQAKLQEAKARFTPLHPEVQHLERQLANLTSDMKQAEAEAKDTTPAAATDVGLSPALVQLRFDRDAAFNRLQTLENQRNETIAEQERIEKLLEQMPPVRSALMVLNRDYDGALAKYRELKAKEMQAQLAENLETERLAERFSLIEQPLLPDEPVRPKRRVVALGGFALSFAFGAAMLVLSEFMAPGIRRRQQLRQLLGDGTPILVIPYIATSRDRIRGALKAAVVVLICAAAIGAAVATVHQRYMPLDVLAARTLQQIESKAAALTGAPG